MFTLVRHKTHRYGKQRTGFVGYETWTVSCGESVNLCTFNNQYLLNAKVLDYMPIILRIPKMMIDFIWFCLFDLILYVPSTVFQLNMDGSSWVEPVLS